ncbi:MAG: pseudouridine synthase [Halieaceae bacterium]|nr:pseudouridine synthase [Halieaceae bacterium]
MNKKPYLVPHTKEPIKILYQDEDLILVKKPDLLLSVPGRHPLNKDCLITRIQANFPTATIVHRLDLDTSGIMVIPLNKSTHSNISRQFQERKVFKEYVAEVYGRMKTKTGEIALPIAPDWANRPIQVIDHQRGKSAATKFKTIQRLPRKTRLLLYPISGRSHQLRLHLQAIGHPIIGCDLYAHEKAFQMSKRLMLHATRIRLTHPSTQKPLEGYCPPDF